MYNIYVDIKVNSSYLKEFLSSERIEIIGEEYRLTGYIREFATGIVKISNIGIYKKNNPVYEGEKTICLPYKVFKMQDNDFYSNLTDLFKLYDILCKMLETTKALKEGYSKHIWYRFHLIFLKKREKRYLHRKRWLERLFEKLSADNGKKIKDI